MHGEVKSYLTVAYCSKGSNRSAENTAGSKVNGFAEISSLPNAAGIWSQIFLLLKGTVSPG
jgi:hypothetical protein